MEAGLSILGLVRHLPGRRLTALWGGTSGTAVACVRAWMMNGEYRLDQPLGVDVMIKLRDRRRRGQEDFAVETPGAPSGCFWGEQPPLAYTRALRALVSCVASTVRLLQQRRIHLPAGWVGRQLGFADGTSARVYRETVVDRDATQEPCVLVVAFRLRAVRGRGHAMFRWESLLNTPLFVGFPGFVSKLWLANDDRGRYRGVYQWDGPRRADHYARALWRVLALVSVRGSIHYAVLPGLRRDELLSQPEILAEVAGADASSWWRLTQVA